MQFDEIFIKGELPENYNNQELVAKGICAWGQVMEGDTMPENFGLGMAAIAGILGSANPNELMKMADKFLEKR